MALALVLALLGGLTPAQEVFHEDSFTGANGQRPPKWRVLGAATPDFWFIDGGKLNTGNGNNYPIGASYLIVETPGSLSWADYTVSAKITPLDPDQGGRLMLVARFVDANNFYFASLTSVAPEGGVPGAREIELVKFSGGAESPLAVISTTRGATVPGFDVPNSGPYEFALTVRGPNLTVSLNGTDVISANDPTFPRGPGGVGQLFSQATFDDFRITKPGASSGTGAVPTPVATPATPRGGSSAGGDWRVSILSNMRRGDAEMRARELESDGIRDVTIVANEVGEYTVYVGRYTTEPEALRAAEALGNEQGLAIAGVEYVVESSGPRGTAATSAIRVRVEDFGDRESADLLKARMGLEGIYPIEVVERGGRFVVYAGANYTKREPAERYAANLTSGAYKNARVEENVPISDLATTFQTNPVTAEQIKQAAQAAGKSLSQSQVSEIQSLIDLQAKAAESGELAQAQAEIARRSEETRRLLADVTSQVEQQRVREVKAKNLIAEFNQMADQRRIPDAERALNELRATDPSNPAISLMLGRLEQLRGASQVSPVEQAQKAANDARAAEAAGDLRGALAHWETVRRIMTTGPLYEDSRRESARISATLAAPPTPPPGEDSGGGNTLVIIIGVVVAIALIGAIGFFVFTLRARNAQRSSAPIARPTPGISGSTPRPIPGGGLSGSLQGLGPAPVFTPEATPVPAQARSSTPVPQGHAASSTPLPVVQDDADAGLNIPGVLPTSPAPQRVPMDGNERIRPGVTSPAPTPGMIAPATPSPVPAGPSSGMVRRPESTPLGVESGGGMEPPNFVEMPSSEFRMPSSTNIPLHPVSSSGQNYVRGAFPPGVFYEQLFNDERVGDSPRGWKGKYDYSTLEVVEGGAGQGQGRCLRFEKKAGAGSAYYSLKFPDASGKIGLEFDIRCDDKNRYLIGFYIEKDEDFRQAVSTIVHRTNQSGPPTLRLQNSQTPYDFKKWVHVRYIIDLPRSLVDGWVDEVPVAVGVKLNQAPKVLNTLSIRDNSQTVGILLLDNVRIYRAS